MTVNAADGRTRPNRMSEHILDLVENHLLSARALHESAVRWRDESAMSSREIERAQSHLLVAESVLDSLMSRRGRTRGKGAGR